MDTTGRRRFLASIIGSLSGLPLIAQYVPKQSDRPEALVGDEIGRAHV